MNLFKWRMDLKYQNTLPETKSEFTPEIDGFREGSMIDFPYRKQREMDRSLTILSLWIGSPSQLFPEPPSKRLMKAENSLALWKKQSLCKCSISGLLFSPIFVQREETIGTRLLQWGHAFGQHQIFQSQFGCSNVPPPLPFQSLFFSFHSSPAATTEPRKKKQKTCTFHWILAG